MQKIIAFSALLSIGSFLAATPVLATAYTVPNNSNSTSPQPLNSGDSLTVASTGTLTISGTNVAVTVSGTSPFATTTITNNGIINQTGTGRAIRSITTGAALSVTNNAGATIEAAGNDAFQMNNTGSVTLYNYGTISTSGASAQAINWNVKNSNGADVSYSNTLYNYAGGSITSYEADAVRPGAGGTIYNSGTIKSVGGAGDTSSSDGIDTQINNSGITIVNGASQTVVGGTTSANLIEGERHGITGGQDVDSKDAGKTYDLPFTESITNNANSTIQGDNGSGINIDGVDATEQVTVMNAGKITGDGVSGDGDGVDVDGVVNLNNSGTILSKDAFADTSEGVTVGGGTIINSGTIEGSVTTAGTASGAVGRGITLAGIDNTEYNGTKTPIAIQKTYTNPFSATGTPNSNPSGASYVTNNAGGLIKGDSDAGIAIAGSATTGTSYAVIITNNATATIEGNSSTVAVIDGSAAVGGTVAPTASTNNETVINYGTIQQDSTGAAISLGSGTNSVQILGGAASINGDISGGTSAGSNTLVIDPNSVTSGQTFSYSHVLSHFNSVSLKSGTITLSGASTYTGATTVSGGTTYINNTSGSGTGKGAIGVSQGATLAGNGIIQPGSGNGITVANGGTLSSGGVQPTPGANGRSTAVVGTGLTLDNTVAKGTILDASVGGAGGANLTFALGAGTYGVNLTSTYMTVVDDGGADTLGELKFATNDTITLNDLTNGGLQFSINTPYILIKATNDADYAGLTTTGDINGQTNQDGYVTTNVTIAGNVGGYKGLKLYLSNGALEVVPEPSTWALMFSGLCVLIFVQARRRGLKS